MKHKTINGWTKELMKAQIRLNMRAKSVNGGVNNGKRCLYRSTYNGEPNACAVGCFIPDEKYSGDLEGLVPSEPHKGGLLTGFQIATSEVAFPLEGGGLRAMQNVHDDSLKTNPAEEVCAWTDENVEDGK